jgi:hypothetical protein
VGKYIYILNILKSVSGTFPTRSAGQKVADRPRPGLKKKVGGYCGCGRDEDQGLVSAEAEAEALRSGCGSSQSPRVVPRGGQGSSKVVAVMDSIQCLSAGQTLLST